MTYFVRRGFGKFQPNTWRYPNYIHPQLRSCRGMWPTLGNPGPDINGIHPGNGGTISQGTYVVEGRQAIDFAGAGGSGCILLPTHASVPFYYDFDQVTLVAWVKTANAGSGFRGVLVKQNQYGIFLNANEAGYYSYGAPAGWNGSGVMVNDNHWHQIASVLDGEANTGRNYVDGRFTGTGTFGISTRTANLTLGSAHPSLSNQNYAGRIDDARIYSRMCTDAEILDMYTREWEMYEQNLPIESVAAPPTGYPPIYKHMQNIEVYT